MHFKILTPLAALALAACASSTTSSPAVTLAPTQSAPPVQDDGRWAFEDSDLPLDPDYRFGRLENGMRYAIRHNATPAGQAEVRLWIGSGSLSETQTERGLAHFVEHMAFNGSTNVPEGEMIKLLEREGLAFGADTNASTGYERTLYKLDLPRNDPELVDTALMIMRETASELTISDESVQRERGVILAERRDRNNFALRNYQDEVAFTAPDAHYRDRLPIGTIETLSAASAADVRGYYAREYVPSNAAVIVVGDIDVDAVQQDIIRRFGSWQAARQPAEPDPGPIPFDRRGETDLFVDPAQSEQVTAMQMGPRLEGPDTVAERRRRLLTRVGYAIVNRRLRRVSRSEASPFRSAGLGTGDVFDVARVSRLLVYTPDGGWKKGIAAAVTEYRRALEYGFSSAEVDEQLAIIRNQTEAAANSADTRSTGALTGAVLSLLEDGLVPTTPASSLERYNAVEPDVTPEAVLAALKADLASFENPLLRYEGRSEPQGGADAIRAAWDSAMSAKLTKGDDLGLGAWAYTDFGTPGTVVADSVDARLGIRRITFANNVRLNLKPTELERDRILFEASIDGGQMLVTREKPLATALFGLLPEAGLGEHSADDLQTLLAGRSVSVRAAAEGEVFTLAGSTRPRDLELQMQLLAASITDPGYRPEAQLQFRRSIRNYFKGLRATPASALSAEKGAILSDNDPRFSLQPLDDFVALTFDDLKKTVSDRLANGALELALVGDFDPEEAIAVVARTLGALPAREDAFRPYADRRNHPFTAYREQREIRHQGEADQALLQMVWPTRDDSDLKADATLELLQRVVQLEVYDVLREELGEAYSPSVSAVQSSIYDGYGTFTLGASLDGGRIEVAREAILGVIARLRREPVDADTLERARKPLAESFANALKTNGGWMGLVDRAQSESERIDRFLAAGDVLDAITAADLQAAAQAYLAPDDRVEFVVVPEEKDPA